MENIMKQLGAKVNALSILLWVAYKTLTVSKRSHGAAFLAHTAAMKAFAEEFKRRGGFGSVPENETKEQLVVRRETYSCYHNAIELTSTTYIIATKEYDAANSEYDAATSKYYAAASEYWEYWRHLATCAGR
jgi:hypothetical protein